MNYLIEFIIQKMTFLESPLDEDLFLRHEKYLHELTEIYEKRIDLTRKIHSWNQVWNEYTQFEVGA